MDYNAAGTGGSNMAPTNPELTRRASASVAALAPPAGELVPSDLVAASGSGVDPHISGAAARFQAARVAAARNVGAERVVQVIERLEGSPEGLGLGDPIVNVLELNLALGGQFGTPSRPPEPAAARPAP